MHSLLSFQGHHCQSWTEYIQKLTVKHLLYEITLNYHPLLLYRKLPLVEIPNHLLTIQRRRVPNQSQHLGMILEKLHHRISLDGSRKPWNGQQGSSSSAAHKCLPQPGISLSLAVVFVGVIHYCLLVLWRWLSGQCMECLDICFEVFQASSNQGESHVPMSWRSVLHPQWSMIAFDVCRCALIFPKRWTKS